MLKKLTSFITKILIITFIILIKPYLKAIQKVARNHKIKFLDKLLTCFFFLYGVLYLKRFTLKLKRTPPFWWLVLKKTKFYSNPSYKDAFLLFFYSWIFKRVKNLIKFLKSKKKRKALGFNFNFKFR